LQKLLVIRKQKSVSGLWLSRLTLGGEIYGAYTDSGDLGRSQLQGMFGGQYNVRKNIALCFGLLGGDYVASPRVGGQLGLSVDFP
jgi:hypothetical protein